MSANWEQFFLALNPFTIATGILTGVLMGILSYPLLWSIAKDFWPMQWVLPSGTLTFLLIVNSLGPLALAFYLSQTIAEYLEGYDTWPRILGRGIVFLIYIVAYAGGVAVQRHRELREEGMAEVFGPDDNLPDDIAEDGDDAKQADDTLEDEDDNDPA